MSIKPARSLVSFQMLSSFQFIFCIGENDESFSKEFPGRQVKK